jgi:hypothetical protein
MKTGAHFGKFILGLFPRQQRESGIFQRPPRSRPVWRWLTLRLSPKAHATPQVRPTSKLNPVTGSRQPLLVVGNRFIQDGKHIPSWIAQDPAILFILW